MLVVQRGAEDASRVERTSELNSCTPKVYAELAGGVGLGGKATSGHLETVEVLTYVTSQMPNGCIAENGFATCPGAYASSY